MPTRRYRRVMGRRWVVGLVPVAVFLAVTFGLRPAVNVVSWLRSSGTYQQYGMSGTWLVGLLAAAATVGVEALLARQRRKGRER
jgi:hypothetical protein